jgi:cephalosporin hydroxylase
MVDESNINLLDTYYGHFRVTYRGVPYYKGPMDYVLYQMIIMNLKPDLIIEIGTNRGGGALYCADLLELIGLSGEVHSINIFNEVIDNQVLTHKRIKLFTDGFENYDIENAKGFNKVLVIDDASHQYEDVLASLNKFSSIVSENSYFIVEDGVISFIGVESKFNGGPRRAISEFLSKNPNFSIDRSICDFFGTNATFNPDGYLKKIS